MNFGSDYTIKIYASSHGHRPFELITQNSFMLCFRCLVVLKMCAKNSKSIIKINLEKNIRKHHLTSLATSVSAVAVDVPV